MAGNYLLTIQQFRRRVSRLSNGRGSVVAQIHLTIVETTDGGIAYASIYVQGWQTSLRVFHQTLNDRVRPILALYESKKKDGCHRSSRQYLEKHSMKYAKSEPPLIRINADISK